MGAIVFLPYLLISLLLPWVCNRIQADRRHLGLAYGLNTVAFCVGLIGFTLLAPMVSIFYSLKLSVVLLVAAVTLLLLLSPGRPIDWWRIAGPAGLLASGIVLTPGTFDVRLTNPYLKLNEARIEGMRSDGANTTFVARQADDDRLFFGNLSMSGTNLLSQTYMRLMAHYPLLTQEDPRSALLICFGVGNTASAIAAHESIERIDAVDLNPNVFRTASYFARTNGDVIEDPRMRRIVDDGRSFLRLTADRYDLITSEPPPPMAAGVYRLYSKEYYEDVLDALTPTGIMSQWLPIYQMPQQAIDLAIATFVQVFPHTLLIVGFDTELILLGSAAPIELGRIAGRMRESRRVRADLASIGIDTPEKLLLRLMRTDAGLREEFAGAGVLSDEHNNLDQLFLAPDNLGVIAYRPLEIQAELQSLRGADDAVPILRHLGRLRYRVDRFPLAGVEPNPAVKLSDVDWTRVAHLQRVAAERHRRGDSAGAIDALRRIVTLAPELPDIQLLLSNELMAAGETRAAIDQIESFVRLEPADAIGYGALGSALLSGGDGAAALAEFIRALELRPDWVEALNNAAWILATHPDPGVRDAGRAIELAETAADLTQRSNPIVLGTLAAAYAAGGRFADAVSAAENAIRRAPGLPDQTVDELRTQLTKYRADESYVDTNLMARQQSRL